MVVPRLVTRRAGRWVRSRMTRRDPPPARPSHVSHSRACGNRSRMVGRPRSGLVMRARAPGPGRRALGCPGAMECLVVTTRGLHGQTTPRTRDPSGRLGAVGCPARHRLDSAAPMQIRMRRRPDIPQRSRCRAHAHPGLVVAQRWVDRGRGCRADVHPSRILGTPRRADPQANLRRSARPESTGELQGDRREERLTRLGLRAERGGLRRTTRAAGSMGLAAGSGELRPAAAMDRR